MLIGCGFSVFVVLTQAPVEPLIAVSIRTSIEVEGGIFIVG
ncbi:hypothetical protein N9F33_02990 [Pseudomonadales bacterium]|nr:hypothetical protein [Pseudomonadales bacterium]